MSAVRPRPGVLSAVAAFPSEVDESTHDLSERFTGVGRRHLLAPGEDIEDAAARAAAEAMRSAGVPPSSIDRLYGYVSVPRYVTPNPLYRLHEELGLRPDALVVPVNSEYSNFVLGLLLATEGLASRPTGHALVVVASNWTRHLDLTQDYAAASSDAAGAAVVGPGGAYVVVDHASRTVGSDYDRMTMAVRPRRAQGWRGLPLDDAGLPVATYEMDPGLFGFLRDAVPQVVVALLGRHGVRADEITLITHQGSRALLDHWADAVRPAHFPDTLAEHGNMTSATYVVTLAESLSTLDTPYVVVAAVGTGLHATAILLERAQA